MCLIVFKESHKSVFTNRQFKYMINRNPDGFGMMWQEDGRVKFEKCMGDDKDKFKLFKKNRFKPTYAMHARIKTHGLINEANCHPYEILNIDKGDAIDLYMMHNGMINNAPDVNKDMSDTWHYVEYVIKPMAKANIGLIWDNESIQDMIQKHIGASKLLFMRSDEVENPVLIFNHEAGTEKDGCWLSNNYSTDAPYKTYNHNTYIGTKFDTKEVVTRDLTDADIEKARKEFQESEYEDWSHLPYNHNYKEKDFTKDGKLYLPSSSKDNKIVELKPKETILISKEDSDKQDLLFMLSMIRGMSDGAIKDYIKDEPEIAADIITGLYTKNTMSYEVVINQIKSTTGIFGIVRLLKDMSVDLDTKTQIKSYK